MMKIILALASVFIFMPAAARAATLEDGIVQSLVSLCLPPVVNGDDAAKMAIMKNLPEMTAADAVKFDKEGGRVFFVPQYPGKVLLIAGKNGACSIVASQFDAKVFWAAVDTYIAQTPFKRRSDHDITDGIQRSYDAKFPAGQTVLFISAKQHVTNSALQGSLTIARVKS